MLLARLVDYAERHPDGLNPPYYSTRTVRYRISLNRHGKPRTPELLDLADEENKNGQRRSVPDCNKTSAVAAHLLVDNGRYVFGPRSGSPKPDRALEEHQAFLDRLQQCVDATGNAEVRAVLKFCMNAPADAVDLPDDFDEKAAIEFNVGGVDPTTAADVQAWWADQMRRGVREGQCGVCGHAAALVERFPVMVKGLGSIGGNAKGTALVSANEAAFVRYGLGESLSASVCDRCAERSHQALNALLADEHHHLRIGNVIVVWWLRDEDTWDWMTALTNPQDDDVKALLEAVRHAKPAPRVAADRFYAVTLAANPGRASVRSWIDVTVADAQRTLARWYIEQRITDWHGTAHAYQGILQLAATTVPHDRKTGRPRWDRLAPGVVPRLLQCATEGVSIPDGLAATVLQRASADGEVRPATAALLKLWLTRRTSHTEENTMVELDPDTPDPAYQCGRLLAVLDNIQYQALGDVGAGVIERFFATASTAPGWVFPRLMQGAQAHLNKLSRDKPPAQQARERQLEEILAHLKQFPRTLNLEEQGRFVLGFYHQRAADRAARTRPASASETTNA